MHFGFRLIPILLLASCSKPTSAPPLPADTIATVGGFPVLQADLDHAMTTAGTRPPADVLRLLTEEAALATYARAEHLDEDPSVRAAIRRLLATRLQEKHLPPVSITDAELATAAPAAPPAAPPSLHLAFLRQQFTTAGSEAEAVAMLEKARTAYQALPESARNNAFGSLAVQFSDDNDTRYQGGDAGWCISGARHLLLPAEATTAAAALPSPGLVPEIIRTPTAAWLVLVLESKIRPIPPSNPEVLRSQLAERKAATARESFLSQVLHSTPIVILRPPPAAPEPALTPAPPANP